MKKLLVSVLVLGLGATSAMAQAASDFATVDADKSGDVTLTEAQTVWSGLADDAYKAADANGDGKVDQTEYEGFLSANPPA
jgi:hypothetical protein